MLETSTGKERSNMVKARIAAHLSQKAVAQKMNVDIKSVINWEKAHTTPHLYQIESLRKAIKFSGTDKELLQVFTVGEPLEESAVISESKTCQVDATHDRIDSSDSHMSVQEFGEDFDMDTMRRKITGTIAATSGIALVNNIQVLSDPIVEPDEYLGLASESIDNWWQWLNEGNYSKVEAKLSKNVPVLKRIAATVSPFQKEAASLTVQAKIMQIILAIHKFDFLGCETNCMEAMQFGELSGNRIILAIALDWRGSIYIYCYRQPETAIPLFNNALAHLGSNDQLNQSSIYINLSVAYAQQGNEREARIHADMARKAMPAYPELDPFYRWLGIGPSELDQFEGKMYLHLAEYFPSSGYAQLAYDAFEKSVNKQATDKDYPCGSLIKRADAARALGKMDGFVEDLTKGLVAGVEIDSIRRISEAGDVMNRIPEKWQREEKIQQLQKDVAHALVVARR